jgi:hypothetical protein
MKKYGENVKLNNNDEFYLNWMIDEFSFPIIEIENQKYKDTKLNSAHNYLDSVVNTQSYIHLNYLVNTYVKPLELRGIKVFYIDSWDKDSSKIIHDIPLIKKNLIYLKSYDGILTQKWDEFENSFPHQRIHHEFQKTENGHPTLMQHQYIAESIIDTIEKFDKKSFIKII